MTRLERLRRWIYSGERPPVHKVARIRRIRGRTPRRKTIHI